MSDRAQSASKNNGHFIITRERSHSRQRPHPKRWHRRVATRPIALHASPCKTDRSVDWCHTGIIFYFLPAITNTRIDHEWSLHDPPRLVWRIAVTIWSHTIRHTNHDLFRLESSYDASHSACPRVIIPPLGTIYRVYRIAFNVGHNLVWNEYIARHASRMDSISSCSNWSKVSFLTTR